MVQATRDLRSMVFLDLDLVHKYHIDEIISSRMATHRHRYIRLKMRLFALN